MKYLKLYENNNDELYTNLSPDEWSKWEYISNNYEDLNIDQPFIDFPINDFIKLKSISNKKFKPTWAYYSIYVTLSCVPWPYKYNGKGISSKEYNMYIKIFLIKDDYYMVKIHSTIKYDGDSYGYIDGSYSYYKCDEFEGLVKLLKDKNLIK